MSTDKTYSLSELALSIQAQLSKVYSGAYWISAEILKLNYYNQSGHCYPQLVEKKNGKIVADLKGFILKGRYILIQRKFIEIAQKELGDGMQIRFRCKVGFHPVYGLSLNILDVDPTHTLGEMTRLRNEAIARLKAEGVFDLNKKLHLPLLIKKVAVISVETSKGYGDFKKIVKQSKYGNLVTQELFPALLQGDAAVESISRALDSIRIRSNEFDVVTIIRGGGGETGLDCYDNYSLGRIICEFPIPVLTGIGHSTNLTIAEQVARKNLSTPSELASFILEGFDVFEEKIISATKRLGYIKRTIIERNKSHLLGLENTISKITMQFLKNSRNSLSERSSKIAYGAISSLKEKKYDLDKKFIPQLRVHQGRFFKNRSLALKVLSTKTSSAVHLFIPRLEKELAHMEEKVRILDPIQTLKRGYSITYLGDKPLKDASNTEKGNTLKTVLAEGEIKSTIN